ncbi:MAG: RNA-binding protein, partial [Planctomycetota bacterium]
MKKLYVGNLPFDATDQDLRELFEQFGEVLSAQIVMDRETGRSRGFGFVEIEADVEQVIEATHGNDFGGRPLVVNEARPREPRGPGGGGGRGGWGGGGGGGRGGWGGGG